MRYVVTLSEVLRGQPEGEVAWTEVDRRAGVSRAHGYRLRVALRDAGLLAWGFPTPGHPAWGRGALRWVSLALAHVPQRARQRVARAVGPYQAFLARRRARMAERPPLPPPSPGFAGSRAGELLARAQLAAGAHPPDAEGAPA